MPLSEDMREIREGIDRVHSVAGSTLGEVRAHRTNVPLMIDGLRTEVRSTGEEVRALRTALHQNLEEQRLLTRDVRSMIERHDKRSNGNGGGGSIVHTLIPWAVKLLIAGGILIVLAGWGDRFAGHFADALAKIMAARIGG